MEAAQGRARPIERTNGARTNVAISQRGPPNSEVANVALLVIRNREARFFMHIMQL